MATHQPTMALPVPSETVSHCEGEGNEEKGEVPPPTSPERFYPEGGREAWLVVFGSFCALAASFGIMSTIGTFQTYFASHQLKASSEGQIGWIFGVYTFIVFFGGIQAGPIFDAAGPRWLIVTGTLFSVIGLAVLAICKSYWHFMLTFGVLCGLGASLISTPAVASVGHWFLVRRGYATGLAATGGSVGGIIFPLIIQSATPRFGFGWAVRIVGFICLLLLLVAGWLIRARLDTTNTVPESLTNMPSWPPLASSLSNSVGKVEKSIPLGSFLKFGSKKNKKKSKRKGTIDLTAFRDPCFTLTTLGIFLIEWSLFILLTYLPTYSLNSLGLPSAFSYQLLSLLNVGSVFGRWLPGIVGDKIGRFNTMILTVAFCLTVVLSLWLPANAVAEENIGGKKAIMVVFALLYGFGSGSGISLSLTCVGQISDTKEYGKRCGTCYSFVSFGTLAGIPLGGHIIHSMNGRFTGLILFTAASYVGALFFFLSARIVGGGKKWRTVF